MEKSADDDYIEDVGREMAAIKEEMRRWDEKVGIDSDGPDAYSVENLKARPPEWRELQNKLQELSLKQEAPLLAELTKSGVHVPTIARLANTGPYQEVLPILITHLQRNYNDHIKSAIAIAIGCSSSRSYWGVLRKEFASRGKKDTLYDEMLANVFVKTAKKTDIPEINDIIDSCENPSRLILLTTLKKFRNRSPEAAAAIERYRHDPEFAKEIASWRPSRPKIAKPKPQ